MWACGQQLVMPAVERAITRYLSDRSMKGTARLRWRSESYQGSLYVKSAFEIEMPALWSLGPQDAAGNQAGCHVASAAATSDVCLPFEGF